MTRPLGRIKEAIAADRPETAMATAGAMCKPLLTGNFEKPPETASVLPFPRSQGGRNMEGKEAARIVALVSLGKKVILFRHGSQAEERLGAIDELSVILRGLRNKQKRHTVPFDLEACRHIAAVALWELAVDMCSTCLGAGEVPLASVIRGKEIDGPQPMTTCPTCQGKRRRVYHEDERIQALAKEHVAVSPDALDDSAVTAMCKEIRAHKRLRDLLFAIDVAKGELLKAERVAVEETARSLERWSD